MTLNYIISIDPDLWRNRKLFPSLIDLPPFLPPNNKEKASGLDTGDGRDKLQVLEMCFLIWNQGSKPLPRWFFFFFFFGGGGGGAIAIWTMPK